MEFDDEQFRSYIKIRTLLGISPKAIHEELSQLNCNSIPAYSTVKKWSNRFSQGETSIHDEPRAGRPTTATSPDNVVAVRCIIDRDPHVTLEDIEEQTGISHGSVESILSDHLHLHKISARWIPKLLSQEQKKERVEASTILLQQMKHWALSQWKQIVTGDESWFSFFEPKRKQQNKVWVSKDAPHPTVIKKTRSANKVLYTIFVSQSGVVLQLPTPEGSTINGRYYADNVLPQVLEKYRNSVSGAYRMWLHHDNAPVHHCAVVMQFIEENNIRVLPHPPYSPDLAIMDFWVLPKLKDALRGRHFETRSALGSAIYQYLTHVSENFFVDAFAEWKRRLQLCIECNGEYFEKI